MAFALFEVSFVVVWCLLLWLLLTELACREFCFPDGFGALLFLFRAR